MMRTILCGLTLVLLVAVSGQGQNAQLPVSTTAPATQAKPDAITGQCHCGQLKYEITGPIIKCSYCDCSGCRRATGTLKAPFVTVAGKDFKVSGGEVAQFRTAAGEKCDAAGAWYACPKCHSPLYWQAHQGKEVDVFAGTLDNPKLFVIKK
jgi:hypothetical protein